MRSGALFAMALTASLTLGPVPPAVADKIAACISYTDNVAMTRASDASSISWFFAGEYARALVARFDSLIGGMPDGVGPVTSLSAHVHTVNGVQAVDLHFYGQNGCDLGPGASLAMFLYSAIVQQIGTGA